MPRQDGTGPMGLGPRTGRGLGPCGGGMAWGRGYGRGIGWQPCCFYPGMRRLTKQEETDILSEEKSALEQELKAVQERISELESKK